MVSTNVLIKLSITAENILKALAGASAVRDLPSGKRNLCDAMRRVSSGLPGYKEWTRTRSPSREPRSPRELLA